MPFIAECCANLFSGLAAATALALFIFDLTAFSIIKKRVNTEAGEGIAVVGNAIWLTLVGMLLLFSTPIMFIVGRCCVR
jgi:hydrogenase-4 membrane subunit HyfE